MTDHNSPEEVEKRKNQEDPIVMYLIVRESLNMSIGKTAAQCAHASQMILLKYFQFIDQEMKNSVDLPVFSRETFDLIKEWLNCSFRKVVLKADEREFAKLQEELKKKIVVVCDAGLTELDPGTNTVIGVCPMRKSERPKLIKRLQVLK